MIRAALCALALLAVSQPAFAAFSYDWAASYDLTRSPAYPNGEKPVAGCTAPASYTEADLGTASGEICDEGSGELSFAVSGLEQPANQHIAYIDAGAGEVQVEGRITDSYTTTTSNFSNVALGIREGALATDYVFQIHSLLNGATAIQCQYGESGTFTTVNGASGQARPRYVAVTRNPVTGDNRGFASADGSTWTEVCSDNEAMADVLAFVGGTSRSSSETLSATIDNYALLTEIDAYDESTDGGGGGGEPTLVTPIDNQGATQGIAFALSCAANFSGATSYSVAGLHGSTGITFNGTTCLFGGTPNANDVGTTNVTVTATNASGDLDETFQLTVAAVPGDVFTIAAANSARVYDCSTTGGAAGATWSSIRTSGSGTQPLAGDVIVLGGGTHGSGTATSGRPLRFNNCTGSSSSPIIVRGDVSDTEPAIIERKTGSNSAGFVVLCDNCNNIEWDGSDGYSGGDSGEPGVVKSGGAKVYNRGNRFNIRITREAAAAHPAAFLHFGGDSCSLGSCVIRGIEIDGVENESAGGGIGIEIDDQNTTPVGAQCRGNIIAEQNWVHEVGGSTGGEGFYFGPNLNEPTHIPFCGPILIQKNIVEDASRDCYNFKGHISGTLSVLDNYAADCGNAAGGTEANAALAVQYESHMTIAGNEFFRTWGPGMRLFYRDHAGGGLAATLLIENNIVRDVGNYTGTLKYGIQMTDSSPLVLTATVRSNTFADVPSLGVNCNTVQGTVINNIFAGVTGNNVAGANCSAPNGTNNWRGTVNAANFADEASDNLELTATSPACDGATSNSPDEDYEGTTRPQDSADDQGADESALCP